MKRGHLLLAALVALAHFLVVVGKPAHVDDTIYLATVQGILDDPLRPLCNTLLWEMEPRPLYTFALNPPLYNYQQAALVALFGWNLPVLHALAAGYVFLAGLAVLALARRFTRWPVAAFLLVMTSPTLLPQTNLMLDVPGMALVCTAVAAWVRGIDTGSKRWLALGAGAAAAALLTKYNSIVVLPLLGWYAVLQQRWKSTLWLGVPLGALAVWCLHNRLFFPAGTIHLLQAQSRFGVTATPAYAHAIKVLESFGSSFLILPALAVLVRFRRAAGFARIVAGVLVATLLVELGILAGATSGSGTALRGLGDTFASLLGFGSQADRPAITLPFWPEYVAFVTNGAVLAAAAVLGLRSPTGGEPFTRDSLFLLAWPLGMSLFNALFAPHHAPRYFFPAFAAVPLLVLRAVDATGVPFSKAGFGISIGAQALLALLLAGSDHAFAAGSRDYAMRLSALDVPKSTPIAYVGHWGFQYYAELGGRLRCLPTAAEPPPVGGVVAVLHDTPAQEFPSWLRTLAPNNKTGELESQVRAPDGATTRLRFRRVMPTQTTPHPWPFQTIGIGNGALLYAPGGYHTLLPYAWNRAPFLALEVLQRVP